MSQTESLAAYEAAVASCSAPMYHSTHRYCPACPWTEHGYQRPTAPAATLGQVAYDAYGNMRGWRVVGGAAMPRWDEQTDELRLAWEGAAKAIVRTVAARALEA